MQEIAKCSKERKFTFGKYKGQTVKSIMEKDPYYVLWVYENVPSFPIFEDELSCCEAVCGEADDLDILEMRDTLYNN